MNLVIIAECGKKPQEQERCIYLVRNEVFDCHGPYPCHVKVPNKSNWSKNEEVTYHIYTKILLGKGNNNKTTVYDKQKQVLRIIIRRENGRKRTD